MPDDTRTTDTAERPQLPAVFAAPSTDILGDPATFEHMQRVAKLFAAAELVPQHLRGKTADCFIALGLARRMNEDPIMVMQNIYFVSGKAGWSAQYMIARANKSGIFKGRISWRTKGEGDALEVTAFAVLADTGQEVSAMASFAMAQAEGWTKNPKYKTMPEHMLKWRSATMLVRLYAPDTMMGMQTAEEIEDTHVLVPGPDGVYRAPQRPARAAFQPSPPTGSADAAAPEPGFELVDESGAVEVTCPLADQWAAHLLAATAPTIDGIFTDKARKYAENNADAAAAIAESMSEEAWKKIQARFNQIAEASAADASVDPKTTAETAAKPQPIQMPMKGASPDIVTYQATIAREINQAADAATVDGILEREAPTLARYAKVAGMLKGHAKRRKTEVK